MLYSRASCAIARASSRHAEIKTACTPPPSRRVLEELCHRGGGGLSWTMRLHKISDPSDCRRRGPGGSECLLSARCVFAYTDTLVAFLADTPPSSPIVLIDIGTFIFGGFEAPAVTVLYDACRHPCGPCLERTILPLGKPRSISLERFPSRAILKMAQAPGLVLS